MQKVKLPKLIDPVKSASKRSDYQGVFLSRDMERLTSAVAAVGETIDVEVKFDKDAQGLNFFQGTLSATVELICQRCNGQFVHPIHVEFCYSPVKDLNSESVSELPEVYEPVEVNDHGEINQLQLFEDELILSLPIVALHAEKDCSVKRDEMQFGEIEPADERPNPFAVLKELKRD
ncbi:23S rRNA accumulation protein YceD [Aliiglaciecola litoralis]|uniref:Large ribosomal RNA subunit accumulation protein YceD n=1 Tax=Aliiglaciecola litoralis TaxID=582857 RepID=A0ABN1LC58_9ALTE